MSLTFVNSESPADKAWGYEFGIDGLMSLDQVREFLGGMSRSAIERHVYSGELRKGRKGRVYFCKRSVIAFASTFEK